MVHFTVACLVAKPLNRREAKGDFAMIQTLLLFKCKLLCYNTNQILVSITTRSPSASLQIKGLVTQCKTVKWPINNLNQTVVTLLQVTQGCIIGQGGGKSLLQNDSKLFHNNHFPHKITKNVNQERDSNSYFLPIFVLNCYVSNLFMGSCS